MNIQQLIVILENINTQDLLTNASGEELYELLAICIQSQAAIESRLKELNDRMEEIDY